ncbi:spoIIIJ-associated protein [Anaerobacterium chartisolvens]|uniref:RNA-binding protein KhpB n=1 Tax=Anaerobacterium chartisolvens TaxID=1297424 RepID=A0A369B3M6_9FIRM|nr:RNA-binding cell elongation regulator Jag/EloR [Anaerobacterium chartisolvens]RCX16139.1 spoIIIJ-associated protein [Anaerobacterium chartisolvens]
MGYSIEKTAKTVQEAISAALEELKTARENVEVEIIDEGNKGIFGLIGNKMAKVRVTVKESPSEIAKSFLMDIFDKMGVNAEVEHEEDEECLTLNIKGKDIGILIGRRGETLDALQYLASLVINKGKDDYKRVVVDIENYRQKREQTLIKLADRLAERVIKYKKSVTLEPMNPYERRIIHASLQDNKYIETYSVGDEPNRKVVIKLK